MFGGCPQLPATAESVVIKSLRVVEHNSDNGAALGSGRKLGAAAEHLIDGSEKTHLSVGLLILESACY